MARRLATTLIVLSLALGASSSAQADCTKSTLELLNFALANVQASFATIRGPLRPGHQLKLTPEAEQFCPRTFILSDVAATDDMYEYWELGFDDDKSGTNDEVVAWIIDTLGPALKSKGYTLIKVEPSDDGWSRLTWSGPPDTGVVIETFRDDETPGITHFDVQTIHVVK